MYPINLKDKNPLDYNASIFNNGTTIIDYLNANRDKDWDSISKNYKDHIREKLRVNQNDKCAYCGGELGITSLLYIDHIAPKSDKLYPRFVFEKNNLVLACDSCNGYKLDYDTIEKLDNIYDRCVFKIVHPYFEDPSDHYTYLTNHQGKKILIQYKTSQGKNTIKELNLNGEKKLMERYKIKHPVISIIRNILDYKK